MPSRNPPERRSRKRPRHGARAGRGPGVSRRMILARGPLRGMLPALLLWLPAPATVAAAPPEGVARALQFAELGVDRGLDARVISALLVDREGFLWVGSRNGLYRYDGYEALRFVPDPGNADSIGDSDIRTLHEARDGTIWVGTNTGGLSRLDPATGRFRTFRNVPDDPTSLSYDSVYQVAEDAEGHVWVATQFGLNRLDPATGRFERFIHDPDDPASLPADYVFPLLTDTAGRVWIGTVGGGLARWDPASRAFERIDLAGASGSFAGHNDVFDLVDAGDGHIWAATRAGVVRVDATTLAAEELPLPEGGMATIPALALDPDGQLWIARMAEGVTIHDTRTGAIRRANPDPPGSPGQLPAVPVLALERTGGKLVVATYDGLFLADVRPEPFSIATAGPDAGALAYFNVTSLHLDARSGTLWAGTFGGGLQTVDPRSLRAEPPLAAVGPDGILSIQALADGRLFAGGTGGLWEIGGAGGARLHSHEPGAAGSIGHGYVISLLADGESGLWIGLGGSGLYRADPQAHGFERLGPDPQAPGALRGDFVTALLRTADDRLWVGTRSNGLSVCQLAPWECRRYSTDTSPQLRHHNVTEVTADSRGRVWIGTDGGGLHLAELDDSGRIAGFGHFGAEQGLVNDSVMAILEDDTGSMWISTRAGVTRLDPATGRAVSYAGASGLPVTHFNARARARNADTLFFGGLGGIVAHPADSPFPTRSRTPVRITAVTRPQQSATEPWRLTNPGRLRVPWGEPFMVRFAALDFAETSHDYAYRLGHGEEWISLGNSREVGIFGLSPGPHTLEIRGRDAFGSWSPVERMAIEVVPPLWMTRGFQAAVAVALAMLLLAWHRLRMRALERKNLALTRLKEEREAAYRQAEASRRDLEESYRGLRQLTQRLESAKEEERRHISRELHDELGQNLTAAKLHLQMLRRDAGDPAGAARLGESVAMMDAMIGQVRRISLSLRPPLLDELGLAAALEQFLFGLSERTGTPVGFKCSQPVGELPPEAATAVFRVVQEAVNNALRHAGANRVRVELGPEEDGTLRVAVGDDGRGFDPAAIHATAQRGDHLGLRGMAERVGALGGRLEIDSRPGHGCTITAWIPRP